jgi:hypothetical protein
MLFAVVAAPPINAAVAAVAAVDAIAAVAAIVAALAYDIVNFKNYSRKVVEGEKEFYLRFLLPLPMPMPPPKPPKLSGD